MATEDRREALESRARDDRPSRVGRVAEDEHARGGGDGRLERGGLQAVLLRGCGLDDHLRVRIEAG